MDTDANQDQITDTVLKERLNTLNPVVREAILSAQISNHLQKLSTKHRLHLDQWNSLEQEVLFVILGLANPNELLGNLVRETHLDFATAAAITADINTEILQPIRDQLATAIDGASETTKASDEPPSRILVTEAEPEPLLAAPNTTPLLQGTGPALAKIPMVSMPPSTANVVQEPQPQASPPTKPIIANTNTATNPENRTRDNAPEDKPKVVRSNLDPKPGAGVTLQGAQRAPENDPYREPVV